MDSKDELFALHSIERNASISSFSLFRYAIVLPGGDRDLDAISQHEQLKIGQIRQYTLQVALALEHLHENSECKIHFFTEDVGLLVSTFVCLDIVLSHPCNPPCRLFIQANESMEI